MTRIHPTGDQNRSCDRICPGRHFAIRMLHLTIARTLAVFDILPPVDENGHSRLPEARYNNVLVRYVILLYHTASES